VDSDSDAPGAGWDSPANRRTREEYAGVFDPALERTVDAMRARFSALMATAPVDPDVTVDPLELGGVPGLRVAAPGAAGIPILWLHSGGYVLGGSREHTSFAASLSRETGRPVLLPDYRMAPEHPFPAAVQDADAALEAALAEFGPELAVGGDSAGGALTLTSARHRRDAGGALPARLVLVSPLADLTGDSPTLVGNADRDPAVSRSALRDVRYVYLAGADAHDADASPALADLGGLPSTLLLVSTAEVLLGDARTIAAAMREGGTAVELVEVDDVVHAWPLFESYLPEGREAIRRIAAFLRD
jgi:epsilon-lactone hydrolase